MQKAGISFAQVSDILLQRLKHNKVCVLVGPDNNRGDGLFIANIVFFRPTNLETQR